MAIIYNTLNDIKQHICNSERADESYKQEALNVLKLFECAQIAENTSMQAVVGFNDSNVPLFWDMSQGNLLATRWTGFAMNYMGCTTVLVSLLLRFTKEKFQYYLFSNDLAPNYLRRNEHCAGSVNSFPYWEEDYFLSLEHLSVELNYRNTLSEDELNMKPFLLVIFGNACCCISNKDIERFREMFSLLLRQGKRLHAACMIMTTRFEDEFLYHEYKETFSCFIVGKTDQKTAKELLKSNIPDWLYDARYRNFFIFQNKEKQVQTQTYYFPLGIGLR